MTQLTLSKIQFNYQMNVKKIVRICFLVLAARLFLIFKKGEFHIVSSRSNATHVERSNTGKCCPLCKNYLQYRPIIQPQNISKQNLDFVMFIISQHGETSFKKRQFIRRFLLHEESSLNIKHIFILGK